MVLRQVFSHCHQTMRDENQILQHSSALEIVFQKVEDRYSFIPNLPLSKTLLPIYSKGKM